MVAALEILKGFCFCLYQDGAVVSPVASQQEGSGFEHGNRLGLFGVKFAFYLHACVAFFWVLCFSSTVQKHAD